MIQATPPLSRAVLRLLQRLAVPVLLAVLLAACGGGGASAPSVPEQYAGEPAAPALETPDDGGALNPAPANKLVLTVPALGGLAAGAEFEARLLGEFTSEVYQGSCRLAFDPAVLEPVGACAGSFIPAAMVTLADTRQTGFVPFAFTGLPGDPGLSAGAGELLTVRFRVLAPAAEARVRFVNDAEFLQLRDRHSRRLNFDIETVTEAAR